MTERLGPSAEQRRDGAGVLRSLRYRILIVWGDGDALANPENHRAMLAHGPCGRCFIGHHSASGHMTPIENPDAATVALRDWMGSIV